ncbi:TPA: hypothetical protein QEL76_002825 [Stenotrophomonas maltophilia]|nr:hypothetical protein [Stenotrophomonas maltophilia]
MNNNRTSLLLFIITAVLALVVHYLMFGLAYLWYVKAEEARLMFAIYAAVAVLIVLLWVFFPSRIAVGIAGVFGLYFPHLIFPSDARPLLGREITLSGVGVTLVSILLLMLATHLRLRWKGGIRRAVRK